MQTTMRCENCGAGFEQPIGAGIFACPSCRWQFEMQVPRHLEPQQLIYQEEPLPMAPPLPIESQLPIVLNVVVHQQPPLSRRKKEKKEPQAGVWEIALATVLVLGAMYVYEVLYLKQVAKETKSILREVDQMIKEPYK